MIDELPSQPVILFDGVCNLCNRSVQFIIRHDPSGKFLFAPLQGRKAAEWMKQWSLDQEAGKSILLIQNGQLYHRSTAALRIAGQLKGPVRSLYIFLVIPRWIRDAVYNWIAANRYRWFGKQDACMIPTPELTKRFIQD